MGSSNSKSSTSKKQAYSVISPPYEKWEESIDQRYLDLVNEIQNKPVNFAFWIERDMTIEEPLRGLIVIENENYAIDLGEDYHHELFDSDKQIDLLKWNQLTKENKLTKLDPLYSSSYFSLCELYKKNIYPWKITQFKEYIDNNLLIEFERNPNIRNDRTLCLWVFSRSEIFSQLPKDIKKLLISFIPKTILDQCCLTQRFHESKKINKYLYYFGKNNCKLIEKVDKSKITKYPC